ncbi:MAG: helix-turn-helix transcriptional regulator [Rhodospirillales bacterium]|nr:helix-turn-helix transcriptional regulator [Rhodospirillales bacterium]MCB9980348.1 helix-turn-helix transcriptional regulator [Rhodospirillales bacterium]
MSQQELAGHIDLTFQQVQKYERGDNRIASSLLYDLAQILKIPPHYFFDGLPPLPTKIKGDK